MRHLIGKDWAAVATDTDRAMINPANGSEIGRIPQTTADDLELALRSAESAFAQWQHRAPTDRGAIQRRFADLLRQNDALIARRITPDEGCRNAINAVKDAGFQTMIFDRDMALA